MSTYVSIGRNRGGVAVNGRTWRKFRADVAEAVDMWASPVVSEATGDGVYDGETESTSIIVGAGEPTGDARSVFELRLAHIARENGQDAIAVCYGPVVFVAPVPRPS